MEKNINNEKLLYLGQGKEIYVNDNHIFGTDAVLLSYFCAPKKHDIALDIGTGCGIIPFLWLTNNENLDVTGVEIQEEAYLLAQKTKSKNNFNIKLYNKDIKDYESYLKKGSFTLISCNPPYFALNDGIKAPKEHRVMQRHEVALNIEDLAFCAKKLLNFGGRLCICIRPERLFEVGDTFKKHGFNIKRVRFVCKDRFSLAKLVLIEAKLGAKFGTIVEPPLLMYENGEETEEIKEIYKNIRDR